MRFEEAAFHTIDKIDRILFFTKEDIKAWANMEVMQEVLVDDLDGRITETLRTLKKAYGVYSGIFCINMKGEIVASSELEHVGRDVSQAPWFQEVGRRPTLYIGDLAYDELVGGFALNFSVPIMASFGEQEAKDVIGVLSSRFNWSELFEITNMVQVTEEGQSESGYVLLINQKGFVISGPGFLLAQEEEDEGVLSSMNLLSSGFESAALALQGEQGYRTETDADGKTWLVGYTGSQGHRDFTGLGWATLVMEETY